MTRQETLPRNGTSVLGFMEASCQAVISYPLVPPGSESHTPSHLPKSPERIIQDIFGNLAGAILPARHQPQDAPLLL